MKVKSIAAFALIAGLLSAPQLSVFLQKYMNRILGPVLILVGMVLLDLLRFNLAGGTVGAYYPLIYIFGIL